MKIKRLLKLVERLLTVPPERFDIQTWVGDDWAGKVDLSCGTTACALGWATTIPEFRKLGLELKRGYTYSEQPRNFVSLKGSIEKPRCHEDSLENAGLFFGLEDDQTRSIFWPSAYLKSEPTPSDVIARIHKLIAADKKKRGVK